MKTCRWPAGLLTAALLSAMPGRPAPAQPAAPLAIEFQQQQARGELAVRIAGREAFVYVYGPEVDLPHFFPIRSPSGKSMTVQKTEPYPHHRSFWFADTVQREGHPPASFYNALYSGTGDPRHPGPPFTNRIRHVAFGELAPGAGQARLGLNLLWEMDSGRTPVLEETRTVRIVALGQGEYFLDLTFRLRAGYGPVTFCSDAAHYAWPYVRLNSDFNTNNCGRLVNSEGGCGQAGTHNQPACWVDFSRTGVADAEGLALFSHPSNPHPHTWLTRDYGTFGPRREAARNGRPFSLGRDETLSTRCGVLVHRGDVQSGRVAERYAAYAAGKL